MVFYQGTNVEMLEETYDKLKKNILPKHKLEQPHFQESEVEYCELQQVLYICSYNHYPVIDNKGPCQHNIDNDIYDTSGLEHEFQYGIYEYIVKTEELMAELKCIDDEEKDNTKQRNIKFNHFTLAIPISRQLLKQNYINLKSAHVMIILKKIFYNQNMKCKMKIQ